MRKGRKFLCSILILCLCLCAEPANLHRVNAAGDDGYSYDDYGYDDDDYGYDDDDDDDYDDDDRRSGYDDYTNPDAQEEITGRKIMLGTQGAEEEIFITYGEQGKFKLDLESADSVYAPFKEQIAYVQYTYSDFDDESMTLEKNGVFTTRGLGKNTVIVTAYNSQWERIEGLEEKSYSITINVNMSGVKLATKKFTEYVAADDGYADTSFSTKITGLPKNISEDTPGFTYSVTAANRAMDVSAELYNGVLYFEVSGTGTTRVTVVLNGKTFSVTISVKEVKFKGSTSFYMTPGKSKTLKVKNGSSAIWKSSNKKVISVTKKGKIKAKRAGNAVITAKVGKIYVGCVVSVVSAKRLKVVKRARYIGTHWTYSQPKRMQKNYYDCSALVWKAYQKEGKSFGSKNYAPVAADVAKYCADHKKIVKGDGWKNIQKMKYLPGALTFKTGAKNGRYKGISHVEMFIGYTLESLDSNGKASLGTKWAARDDNYDFGEVWAQP